VETRFLRHQRDAELDARNAKLLLELGREADDDVVMRAKNQLSQLHDPAALRGIPAVGRGSGGAIRGTRPGDGLVN
jgi:hypothetical protein